MQKEKVVFVPVEASTELPERWHENNNTTIDVATVLPSGKIDFGYFITDPDGSIRYFSYRSHENVSPVSWLQPLPDKYILSEDELRKVKEDAWEACNNYAEERAKYPYGKRTEWEHPDKEHYLKQLNKNI
jgi:hypothetical protein